MKTHWKILIAVAGLLILTSLIVWLWPRPKQTLYVLPEPVPVDSVRSYPTTSEQSAETRWDSLKKLQP